MEWAERNRCQMSPWTKEKGWNQTRLVVLGNFQKLGIGTKKHSHMWPIHCSATRVAQANGCHGSVLKQEVEADNYMRRPEG